MPYFSRFTKAIIPLASLALIACGGGGTTSEPHLVHQFGGWHREEDRHFRICTICGEKEEGAHEGGVCEVCAEFKALGLGFLEGGDGAHADFAQEANEWFPKMGKENGFLYDFSTDFGMLNEETLEDYDLIMFLNNLPYVESQRHAFEEYMENGGAWMGFHICAFTTEASSWPWYHENFLGTGNYRTNTWNPTAERLKVETHDHPATKFLGDSIMSSPNEWYGWENDLRENEDIQILLSLDDSMEDSTFPIGDRVGEIWDSGYWPVAWANKNYNMIYMNMGHNLMPYNDFEKYSRTFSSKEENEFIIEGMFGIVNRR